MVENTTTGSACNVNREAGLRDSNICRRPRGTRVLRVAAGGTGGDAADEWGVLACAEAIRRATFEPGMGERVFAGLTAEDVHELPLDVLMPLPPAMECVGLRLREGKTDAPRPAALAL